jgi:hypothetical protein
MTAWAWQGSWRTLGLWAAVTVALASGCGSAVDSPPGAVGTVAGCEGDDCGGPSPGEVPVPSPVEGPVIHPSPTPTGPPPPDPRRPAEIVAVMPPEDQLFDPNPDCLQWGCTLPSLGGISARVRFPGEDTLASGRMVIDGAEVPVAVTTETPVPPSSADGNVGYSFTNGPLGAGPHEVTVEVTSREGQVVTYTWRFAFTD